MIVTSNIFKFLEKYHKENKKLALFLAAFVVGQEGRWLAGGALRRSILDGNPDSDWDMFFKNEATLNIFVDQCRRLGLEDIKENENNISFTVKLKLEGQEIVYKVQAIKIAFYSNPEEVISSFDYTICQFATDGASLWSGETSLFDLGRKRLMVNKITYPVASLRRMLKYTNQGFYACNGCLNDLLESVAKKPELLNQKFAYID